MATSDTCCTIVPYFKAHEGRIEELQALCDRMVEQTKEESGVLYYGFSFDEDEVHCREGYIDAEGALAHLENIGPLLQETLQIADLTRLEVHGPADELDQLRGPMAELDPQFFTLLYGFRR
jgi:quinol monooxygenase YgiN